MKKQQISDHFSCSAVLLFSLPSIGMQLVDNTYQVADGYFISNYIGSSAFAAENLIFPPLLIVSGVGVMFGTGAAALISYSLGQGDRDKANRQLSLTVGTLSAAAVLLSVLLFLLIPWIAGLIGVPENMLPMCAEYGRILAALMPFQILNGAFHPLLITADRLGLGMMVSVINAAVNILLDWIAVALLGWGLKGAALATGLAWIISASVSLGYFFNRSHSLHFGYFHWDAKDVGQICYNGASEMADVISYALIALLFNRQLLRYIGESGVSAYAVSGYISGIFMAAFFGIAMSMTPATGFHIGERNFDEVRSILKNNILVALFLGICMTAVSFAFSRQIAGIFVGYDQELLILSVEALRIIAFSYLLSGVSTFFASFYTGMGDGTASLCVAVTRSFAFPLIALFMLPRLFGRVGIWMVAPLAELAALLTACFFLMQYRKKGDL